MTQQYDAKGELRAAHFTRQLNTAKHTMPEGGIGVFMRVTLAVIFMYMIVFSYQTFGIAGPVLVSVLFLAALLGPFLYHIVKSALDKRRVQPVRAIEESEVRQEG